MTIALTLAPPWSARNRWRAPAQGRADAARASSTSPIPHSRCDDDIDTPVGDRLRHGERRRRFEAQNHIALVAPDEGAGPLAGNGDHGHVPNDEVGSAHAVDVDQVHSVTHPDHS